MASKKYIESRDNLVKAIDLANDVLLLAVVSGEKKDGSAQILSITDYYPFGMEMDGRKYVKDGGYRYGFTGHEKESDLANDVYTTDYRLLDTRIGRWLSVDPLADKYAGMSPYNYCEGNPIIIIDPNGESTIVAKNENGTYTVQEDKKASKYDNDNGIYLNDEAKTLIGYSATPESFFHADKDVPMAGVIIDPNDNSGREFLNFTIQSKELNLFEYMWKALPGHEYDFKKTNGYGTVKYSTLEEFYRGMPINLKGENPNLPVYASARDIGNMGAGLVAGIRNFSWGKSRYVFDLLESYQDCIKDWISEYKTHGKEGNYNFDKYTGWKTEALQTQYGEYLGWRIGSQMYNQASYREISRLPSYGGIKIPSVSNSILQTNEFPKR